MSTDFGKWFHSSREEDWHCCEAFDTRQEAIAFAPKCDCADHFPGDPFFVGQASDPKTAPDQESIDPDWAWVATNVTEHSVPEDTDGA